MSDFDPQRYEPVAFVKGIYWDARTHREQWAEDTAEQADIITRDAIATFRHQVLSVVEAHPEVAWPALPRFDNQDLSGFLQLREIEDWAYQVLTQANARPAKDRYALFGEHPNWTVGLGQTVRLLIRNSPGLEKSAIVESKNIRGQRGAGMLHEYLGWLTRKGGNGTAYSAYTPGKGYFMSEEAYRVWSEFVKNPEARDKHYQRWLDGLLERREQGDLEALPFGYHEDD
jgi:hypothetical protein